MTLDICFITLLQRPLSVLHFTELEDGNIEGQQRYSLLFYNKTFMEGKVS